jgi:SWI/SNF-related matrix-associated actin-dependent regulator 1 of chromatin subfamily A
MVDLVKGLPGRGWDPTNKCWAVPEIHEAYVRKFAQENGFKFTEDIADEVVGVAPELPELSVNIPLKLNLFPYQAKGVAYALDKKKVIIGDQPGLGKTAQAIATITGANAFPVLVICPSSLKINWQREWHMWTDKKAMILTDNVKQNFHLFWSSGLCQVFIVNYESLKKYFVQSINKPSEKAKLRLDHIKFKDQMKDIFKSVIIDESHRVKSTGTQQTKFTKGVAMGKEYILALTGTPVVNKPKDLISQLGIIEKLGRLGGYQHFVKRYCGGTNEASNLRELNYMLNLHCFYRRDKQDVLKDLPAKMRQVVSCDITTRKEYAVAEANLVKYLMDYKNASDEQIERSLRGEIMVTIGILKNISARGKLNDVFEFVDDILESGEKLVIFAHLKEVISAIKKQYPQAVTITGDDNQAHRQFAIDSFQQNPDTKLIICSIKAAGVGLTLTAASRVSFVELPWTAADCDQCEDRCHRIGQKDSVTASYFLGQDTIDEKIYQIIQRKRDIASTITGSQEQIEEDFVNLVADLFNQPIEA